MTWQIAVFILILAWFIGSFVWLQRLDEKEQERRSKDWSRIQIVVSIVLLLVILTTLL